MEKTFRRYDQDQPMLLAPDLRDWLPAEHPARWVDDLVEHGLDLAPFFDDYTEVRGAPPYDPRLMLKLLIFGYSNGITSSRALERRCHHNVAFMFTQALGLCAPRGLDNAQGEWTLKAFCHNVRKLRNSDFHWIPTEAFS